MAGKTIEETRAAHKLALEKKTPSSSISKILITVKDVNRCAFTVMVDSETTSLSPPHPEFAGLTCNPIPIATIDEAEYDGWVVIEEEPIATVDWN